MLRFWQRKNIGRLLHPSLVEEEFDLLLAETLDIEGAARGEQFQVLDLLDRDRRTRRCSGRARPPRRSRSPRAPLRCAAGTDTCSEIEMSFAFLRPLVDHHIDDLRDHVAGALDDDGVADPDIAPLAQLLAVAADAPDVILIVQRDVLHDDAADTDRLELADRRERAGAPDLDLDIAQHRHGALGRKLVRDRPARRARHEAEALLPVETIHLVDDAVDIVVELGARFLDLAMKGDQLLDRVAKSGQRIGREAAALEPFDHARLGLLRHLAHLAPGIGEEAERTRGGDRRVLLAQRARGRIARIGEDGVAGGFLPLVQRQKRPSWSCRLRRAPRRYRARCGPSAFSARPPACGYWR